MKLYPYILANNLMMAMYSAPLVKSRNRSIQLLCYCFLGQAF